jgi:hypothetical protein
MHRSVTTRFAADQIQRVFALIELLRGVAAFLVAPVVLHFAKTVSPTPRLARTLRPGCVWGSRARVSGPPCTCSFAVASSCDRRDLRRGSKERTRRSPRHRSLPASAASTRSRAVCNRRVSLPGRAAQSAVGDSRAAVFARHRQRAARLSVRAAIIPSTGAPAASGGLPRPGGRGPRRRGGRPRRGLDPVDLYRARADPGELAIPSVAGSEGIAERRWPPDCERVQPHLRHGRVRSRAVLSGSRAGESTEDGPTPQYCSLVRRVRIPVAVYATLLQIRLRCPSGRGLRTTYGQRLRSESGMTQVALERGRARNGNLAAVSRVGFDEVWTSRSPGGS